MNKLNVLNDLVSIRSDKDCEEILTYIENKLKDKVKEILYVSNKENSKNNMLIGINTELKDIEPIVLSGHIDTVGADESKYLTNPYSLVIKDNKAYGLGVIDMKCFTASVIDLIDELKELNCPIILALTADEETDLYGINNVIDKLKELNIKPKFTIVGEPTNMEINNVSNGCFDYKVEAYGKSCHSSTPEIGINSICILAKLVTYIERLSKKHNDLTMSCDLFQGGTIINRVPDYASMSFDVRTTNMNNYNEVIRLINNKINKLKKEYNCKIDITNGVKLPPLVNKNDKLITSLAESLNLKINKFSGGCEAGYYSSYSGDAILFGTGLLSLAHKPNEYMVIDDYYKYNDKLIKLLNKIIKEYYKKA